MVVPASLGKGAPPPATPSKLAHIVLRTPSVDRMRDWYAEVLGAKVVHQSEAPAKLCFLTFDEEHHRLALVEEPGVAVAKDGARASLDHIAFTYAGLGDLVATYERLAARGIEPFWPIHHGPTVSLYYLDPDGNRIELQVDAMTAQDAQTYVESAEFGANPIGVIFDPADLAARFAAGQPESDLLKRPPLPPGLSPLDMLKA